MSSLPREWQLVGVTGARVLAQGERRTLGGRRDDPEMVEDVFTLSMQGEMVRGVATLCLEGGRYTSTLYVEDRW